MHTRVNHKRTMTLYKAPGSFFTASSNMGVMVIQGATAFTLMRDLAHSHDKLFVRDIMAALLIPYAAPVPELINPAQLATFTTQAELSAEAVAAVKRNGWNNLQRK